MRKILLMMVGIAAGVLSFAGTGGRSGYSLKEGGPGSVNVNHSGEISSADEYSTGGEVSYSQAQEEADSSVAVIAWFDKRDTMTYWINEGSWTVKDGDTTKISGVSTKVMLTVTDSTKKGYGIEYKFLEFQNDTVDGSPLGDFQNRLVARLSDKIAGTTIRFRTDEYGRIKKYENLKEIKKQARELFDSACEEMMKLPVMDSLKSVGINLDAILKGVDIDPIVDGYTEEIETLFNCHGKEYKVGDYDEHTDESQKAYASDLHMSVNMDPETMEYEISSTVDTKIPAKDLKDMMGALVEMVSDKSLQEDFDKEYDKQVKEDAEVGTWNYWRYFADGWPAEVVSQTTIRLMGQSRLKQKQIVWDYRSVGNSR